MGKRYRINNFSDNRAQYIPSKHAKRRMAQRNVSIGNIEFVLKNGQWLHRAGVVFVFLGSRDIENIQETKQEYARLEGTIVVLSRDGSRIITVYRNRQQGLRKIKQKENYGRHATCYKDILLLNKIAV